MTYFDERTKLEHRLEGLTKGLGDDLTKSFENALSEVSGKITALEAKAEQTESLIKKKKYLKAQREAIEIVLSDIYRDIGDTIMAQAIELAQEAPSIVDTMVKKIIPAGLEIELGVPVLDKKRIISMFESFNIEGLNLNQWLSKIEANAAQRIIKASKDSFVLNESRRESAKRLQGALDVSRKSAEGLAHNAVHQAWNFAEMEYFKESQQRLKGFRFMAELDRKTTPLCVSLDGRIFSVSEAPKPPLHWKCRSSLHPIFKNQELNKIFDKGSRVSRQDTGGRWVNHRDGTRSTKYEKLRSKKVSNKKNYRDWMQDLVNSNDPKDRAFAKEALGKKRFELVSKGKLNVDSLYYDGKLRTVKQLKELMQ